MDNASGRSAPLPDDGLPVMERSVMRLVVLDAGPRDIRSAVSTLAAPSSRCSPRLQLVRAPAGGRTGRAGGARFPMSRCLYLW
jgi:hypothetical protein